MKNSFFKYSLLLVFAICSCDKHLNIAPISNISNASFWQTEDDATSATMGMYDQLRGFAELGLLLVGEARSESVQSDGLVGDTHERYHRNLLDAYSLPGPGWTTLYKVINTCNLIFEHIENVQFVNESTKSNLLAQAYAMRAYSYFIMVRTWGEVPLRILPTENADPAMIYLPKSSEQEVFSLIKSDIETALGLFTDNSFPDGRHLWSKPAVNALKADVYLWTAKRLGGGENDATQALAAATEARQSDVQLLSDYSDIFKYANKGNKEVLMAIRFFQDEASNNYFNQMYMPSFALAGNPSQESREIIGTPGGNLILSPSAILRGQFEADDQRRDATFHELYTTVDGTEKFHASFPLKGKGFEEGGVRYFLDDVILYRLSDVLLMAAEAKNLLNQDPSEEINSVRERAFGEHFDEYKFVTGSQAENDEAILKERLLELCFEAKRWWDLVRFDKAFELVPSLQGKESQRHLLYFPIPTSVLNLEPLVTQVDGYE
ncbi:RagB/SusD family nutrient uptake outer membrane protein [Parapedobacter pyrenivorans]|nr:RagB/SusD family nutrient uptake outer membrane protein [Parapedobacter pyrenivorans]